MTTADIILGFNALGDWLMRVELYVAEVFTAFLDDAVDGYRWLRRARLRRKKRRPGAHRVGERSLTIWEIYHRMNDVELAKSGWRLVREPGIHRDRRGWRYAPAMWKQLPVWECERRMAESRLEETRYWSGLVDALMDDIKRMLENPPEPETLHGCRNCLCGVEV